MKELIGRKLLVSILTSFIFSAGILLVSFIRSKDFFFLFILPFITIYAGAIILVYGSLISIIIEKFIKKADKKKIPVLYILFNGFFGLIGGLILDLADESNWELAPLGGLCGLTYALIDILICTRFKIHIILTILLIYGSLLVSLYLQ
ncbi:hypothetical protein KUV80_10800 [Fictibacillus nanhaiensis]|uniref:hypothetical protein n=1 Tax=Fictibacillus nanhaiensis TaxID=742169 RepID=UPI001C970523|nr:hypothetical protein [Fictibacillus nanhaiensis]MBY6037148.1 hypothetical protein [Fictibacillus nanhaiensis]